jgi:phage tail-like protein
VDGLGSDPLQPGGEPSPGVGETAEAGFQSVGTPEYTVEAAEYREGIKTYTEKYPGIPTTNEVMFNRGVARKDTAFREWVVAVIEGAEYRSDITIYHALREGRSSPFNPDTDFTAENSKRYTLRNAWPMRVKIAGDLDASTSDVSLAEVEVAYEEFDVATPTLT